VAGLVPFIDMESVEAVATYFRLPTARTSEQGLARAMLEEVMHNLNLGNRCSRQPEAIAIARDAWSWVKDQDRPDCLSLALCCGLLQLEVDYVQRGLLGIWQPPTQEEAA
jgi:hypothetical protein